MTAAPSSAGTTAPTRLTLILAATRTNGIGQGGGLPWRLSREMAYFRQATSFVPALDAGGAAAGRRLNAVVMGRKSWESIPPRFRPLKSRFNVVVSTQADFDLGGAPDTVLATSLGDALERLRAEAPKQGVEIARTFLIGGASLYSSALRAPSTAEYELERVLLTRIDSPAFEDCDTFVPELPTEGGTQGWKRCPEDALAKWLEGGVDLARGEQVEGDVQYHFEMWER